MGIAKLQQASVGMVGVGRGAVLVGCMKSASHFFVAGEAVPGVL